MAKACQKHLAAVLELKVAQMPHFVAWVLKVAQRPALMAAQTLTFAGLVLMADRMLYSDLVQMVDQMLYFDRVPRVVRRLYSVERVLRVDQTLAGVVDPSQRTAQRHCSVADREPTVGQTLKLDQTLLLVAVHFARKVMAVLGWLVLSGRTDSPEHHLQADRMRLLDQVWMAVQMPLLALRVGQMYLPMLLIVQRDLVWPLGPMVDQILPQRAVQRQASVQGLRGSRMLQQLVLCSPIAQMDSVFDRDLKAVQMLRHHLERMVGRMHQPEWAD